MALDPQKGSFTHEDSTLPTKGVHQMQQNTARQQQPLDSCNRILLNEILARKLAKLSPRGKVETRALAPIAPLPLNRV